MSRDRLGRKAARIFIATPGPGGVIKGDLLRLSDANGRQVPRDGIGVSVNLLDGSDLAYQRDRLADDFCALTLRTFYLSIPT
jgi:hypothetical protein